MLIGAFGIVIMLIGAELSGEGERYSYQTQECISIPQDVTHRRLGQTRLQLGSSKLSIQQQMKTERPVRTVRWKRGDWPMRESMTRNSIEECKQLKKSSVSKCVAEIELADLMFLVVVLMYEEDGLYLVDQCTKLNQDSTAAIWACVKFLITEAAMESDETKLGSFHKKFFDISLYMEMQGVETEMKKQFPEIEKWGGTTFRKYQVKEES